MEKSFRQYDVIEAIVLVFGIQNAYDVRATLVFCKMLDKNSSLFFFFFKMICWEQSLFSWPGWYANTSTEEEITMHITCSYAFWLMCRFFQVKLEIYNISSTAIVAILLLLSLSCILGDSSLVVSIMCIVDWNK